MKHLSAKRDLLVVGAGPAGAIAAFEAARAGLKVLLLDKRDFPRPKPCGGGLSAKSLKRIPFSVADVVGHSTERLWIARGGRRPKKLLANGIVCAFVTRAEFDSFLLQAACDAGAEFQRIDGVGWVDTRPESISLGLNEGDTISAQYVVAADGANSRMRRLAPPDGLETRRGFAVEGTVPYAKLNNVPEMTFDFGIVPHGYGWLFPKGDHVNVGLYTNNAGVSLSKEALRSFARCNLGTACIDDITGFPIGFGGMSYRPSSGRLLFAGDAAGFAEPLLGEGLHNAIASGSEAGRAVVAGVRSDKPAGEYYDGALVDLRGDLKRSAALAHRFFYPLLNVGAYEALRAPIVHRTIMRGFAAGLTMCEITSGKALRTSIPPAFPLTASPRNDL